jgi:hypothetical protein
LCKVEPRKERGFFMEKNRVTSESSVDLDMIINWLAPGEVPVSINESSGFVVFGRERVGETSLCFASYMKAETNDDGVKQTEISRSRGRSYYDAFRGLNSKVQDAIRAGLRVKAEENSVK